MIELNSEVKELNISVEVHEGKFNPNNVKMLVYADSGVGKTVFASSWPDVVFLDIDKGMASVTKEVHRIPVDDWHDLQEAYMFLSYGDHDFKTVAVDSLNELQYLAMANIVDSFPSIRRAYDNLPSQSDYGKMLDDFDKFVRALRGLSMNIVFIANRSQQEYETDPVQPQMVGKNTSRNITRMVDIVGYMYRVDTAEPVKPRVMVFDAVNYVTKDRSGKLPATVHNPTYTKLYELWTKE